MPTYADEYNERLAQAGGVVRSAPVRLTISRGAARGVRPDGTVEYDEVWSEEELMDLEHELVDQLRDSHAIQSLAAHGLCLWVLDTNTLLTAPSLAWLQDLFTHCYTYASTHAAPPPIALIIPYTVLSELDGLKSSPKPSVAYHARLATKWLLTALQTQKHSIPEPTWALHVQSASHAAASANAAHTHTGVNDERIVALCRQIAAPASASGSQTFFVSEDVNARTRAEIEGVRTLSLETVSKASTPAQLLGLPTSMDIEVEVEMQPEPQPGPEPKPIADPRLEPADPNRGRSISDSMHASQPDHRDRTPQPSPPPQPAPMDAADSGTETNPFFEWPADRSSSRRW